MMGHHLMKYSTWEYSVQGHSCEGGGWGSIAGITMSCVTCPPSHHWSHLGHKSSTLQHLQYQATLHIGTLLVMQVAGRVWYLFLRVISFEMRQLGLLIWCLPWWVWGRWWKLYLPRFYYCSILFLLLALFFSFKWFSLLCYSLAIGLCNFIALLIL